MLVAATVGESRLRQWEPCPYRMTSRGDVGLFTEVGSLVIPDIGFTLPASKRLGDALLAKVFAS